jgi:hypothetical protein
MKSLSTISLVTLVAVVDAIPAIPKHAPLVERATPKVYLAGDSTMTHYAASSVIQGPFHDLHISSSID